MQDGLNRHHLQYRTAGDAKVCSTDGGTAGITLPASYMFWAEFYPPNGWQLVVFRGPGTQIQVSAYKTTK